MRIAFLSRYQNTVNRGAEVFVEELTLRLRKNYQIDVFSGVEADSLNKVISGKYDVVVPINGRLQSLKVFLCKSLGHYKILITGHSGIGRDDLWNLVVTKPDVFVALTDHMVKWARIWGWGTKVVKIPNGVDLDKFSPFGESMKLDLEKPIILSVGALVWYKGHDKAIQAVSNLKKGSLLIIGKGEQENYLNELGQEKLGNRFKIMSFDNAHMPKIYRSVDLFTLPSWDREAFGIVYLEALASNLPVVAPNDASRREIIGKSGEFTDVNDPIEYASAIETALSKKWDNIPRNQAGKFSWTTVVSKYEQLFKSLVNK